LLASCTARSVC